VADQEEVVRKCSDILLKWLKREPAPATADTTYDVEPQVRVFCIIKGQTAPDIAQKVYVNPSLSTFFHCKAYVGYDPYIDDAFSLLSEIVREIGLRVQCQGVEQLASKLQQHLKGKRFLIAVTIRDDLMSSADKWKCLLDPLFHAADGCHPGSAIIFTACTRVALSSFPYNIINATTTADEFYTYQARKLGAEDSESMNIQDLFADCKPNTFAMKMFLHLLYVNPNRTDDELEKYAHAIKASKGLNKSVSKQVLMFCYNELPIKYRSCLLYLSIYPQGRVIMTTSLTRRWVAEGLIAATGSHGKQRALTDEAEHHLDVLFTRGFVTPVEISPGGDIKSFTLHHEVCEFITKIARDVNFVETSQPTGLDHHLSIHNRIGWQNSHSELGIVASLPSLAASPQWKLLKVLDLEGCQGLDSGEASSEEHLQGTAAQVFEPQGY
jgi:hypothetical protein